MNRIAARITEKVVNSAQEFTEIAEELPQKLQNEWSSFKKEVIEESERLEKKTNASKEKSSKKQLNKEDLAKVKSYFENGKDASQEIIDLNKSKAKTKTKSKKVEIKSKQSYFPNRLIGKS